VPILADRACIGAAEKLRMCEQALGESHPATQTARHNLGVAYCEAGDVQRAIPLLELTLRQRQAAFGERHPETLTTRNGLGCAYMAAGDEDRAIAFHEKTMAPSSVSNSIGPGAAAYRDGSLSKGARFRVTSETAALTTSASLLLRPAGALPAWRTPR
jgi:tetratricopeptide (TPR) repeat protein